MPNNSGKRQAGDRQPEIHHGGRAVQQDGVLSRRRHGHAQQRRARRHYHRRAGRPGRNPTTLVATRRFAAAGAHQGRGGRRRGPRSFRDLDSSVSLFFLDQASEIVFKGDAGDTSASRPSQRYGVEWTNDYRPTSWLTFDGDLALSHARFLGYDTEQADLYASLAGFPQAQIGNAPGNYIPNAPAIVASAGITIGEKTGWFGTLRWRYLGRARSPKTTRSGHRRPAFSTAASAIGLKMDGGSSSTCSICSTPRPTRSPMPMDR